MMKKIFFAIPLVILVLLIFFGLPIILAKYCGINLDTLGTYGDFFGSFNALVSALAFGGLIYTIILQRKDLKLQREELKLTREEMQRQAEAQEKAAKEQERHALLLEEQLYKEIRPYLNVFITHENGSLYLVIKNIGKSTCTDFSAHVLSTEPEDDIAKKILLGLETKLNTISFSVIPSGLDYAIPLEISIGDVKDLLQSSSIKVHFSFYFRKTKEEFTINFKFNEIQNHSNPVARALFHICNQMATSNI